MATCIHGTRLTENIRERCAWCALEVERASRLDNINRLRELIIKYGKFRRDVGAFGGVNSESGRKALREASAEAGRVYEEIERILFLIRDGQLSTPGSPPKRNQPEASPATGDPGQKQKYGCATCGEFVEYVPAKFSGDPDQGWRHVGVLPSGNRPHIPMPQNLGS